MKPALLVLAAGMGSRYGGLKQMDTLGPGGETIIDYSIYDAIRSGFGKIVYIVRESFRDVMEKSVREKYSNLRCNDGTPVDIRFVTQELDKIPAGFPVNPERVKPWGTAHAMLMAKDEINEPFAVINGDDFYGRDSFEVIAKWLSAHTEEKGKYCIVGYHLENTLAKSGGVSRGICYYDNAKYLTGIVEHLDLARRDGGAITGVNSDTSEQATLAEGTLVSMNMWGFTPDFFERTEAIFKDFLKEYSNELKKEFYITYVIDRMIKEKYASVEVLDTTACWFGVTFKEDREDVMEKFATLAKEGVYPNPLY